MLKNIILTFLMSMVPVIELRGSIPFGVVQGLSPMLAFVISIIGNLVPIPFAVVFIRRLLEWLRPKAKILNDFVSWLERKADKNKDQVEKSEFWGLMILVAIPLPGTGAWTGALVAAMLDMRLKRAMPAITVGVIVAGLIVLGLTCGVSIFL